MLDTLPVCAHTTMSDALWAGVPAVTCLGRSLVGRVGASLLTAVGLAELVTKNPAEYEALALALARDPTRLSAIRQHLARRAALPLFDTARFMREIETAYAEIWALWQAGAPPRHIEIPS
jgi:predicted O-linked N-acetylglucosamine transferase (SPINDLY family)